MGSRETVGSFAGPTAAVIRRPDVNARTWAGLLALAAAAAPFLARLAINARAPVPLDLPAGMGALTAAAVAGPSLAAVALAVRTGDAVERVGLAFVAGFGLLWLFAPAPAAPTAVAVVGGGVLAAGARWRAHRELAVGWRLAPAVAIPLGTALSLSAAVGLAPGTARPVGAHLALLGAAATPALSVHHSRDWALGGLVGGLLVAVGLSAPFLTGAVALVGGGVVAVSLPVMAVGLAGLVTTAGAGLRTRRPQVAIGAGLLLVAGVPATLPRALAALLGLLVLIEGGGRS